MNGFTGGAEKNEAFDASFCEMNGVLDLGFDVNVYLAGGLGS